MAGRNANRPRGKVQFEVTACAMRADTKPFEILLAEDNPADADLVGLALKQHEVPCSLHLVRDGAKAIEMIETLDHAPKASSLDLCIIDMHLPRRGGEAILKCLRSTERYSQTPVIVMSGLDPSLMEQKATKHAAMVYFSKPSTVDEYLRLGSIVKDVLRQSGGAE